MARGAQNDFYIFKRLYKGKEGRKGGRKEEKKERKKEGKKEGKEKSKTKPKEYVIETICGPQSLKYL